MQHSVNKFILFLELRFMLKSEFLSPRYYIFFKRIKKFRFFTKSLYLSRSLNTSRLLFSFSMIDKFLCLIIVYDSLLDEFAHPNRQRVPELPDGPISLHQACHE